MHSATKEERIGAIGIHEGTHATDTERDDGQLEREKRAYSNQDKYLKQMWMKRYIVDKNRADHTINNFNNEIK